MKVEAVHYGVTSIITFFPEIPESVAHVQTRSKMSKKYIKFKETTLTLVFVASNKVRQSHRLETDFQ